jgi:hypothetical protein
MVIGNKKNERKKRRNLITTRRKINEKAIDGLFRMNEDFLVTESFYLHSQVENEKKIKREKRMTETKKKKKVEKNNNNIFL